MSVVEDGSVYQVGTFSGNPMSMAATRASLEKVLTPAAYEHLDKMNQRLMDGCSANITKYDFPGYAQGFGAKGCVTFSTHKIADYVSFRKGQNAALNQLSWLYQANRGFYMAPGREEEWILSVAHDEKACHTYLAAFDEMAHVLAE